MYEKVIEKHVAAELPFMATENIIMECVKAGGDRQKLHERIRVLSQEAGRMVKEEGKENDLLERIAADKTFAAVHGKLDEVVSPMRFIGRAPEQTEEFIATEIDPILRRHAALLGITGDVKI